MLSFHVPGHQGGRGADPELHRLLGTPTLWADLTEVLGIDDLHRPTGQIKEAQELAAETFGAEETHFLINGSTSGNQAMLLATTGPGDLVLMPRNAHRSLWSGLMLSGASAAVYDPPFDHELGVYAVATAETVQQAKARHPQAKAFVLSSPSYHGHAADTKAVVEAAHEHTMLLLADEAWGAHLGFHEGYPTSAVHAGADLTVQSTHKMLPSLTQTAMLHVNGERVDRHRLDQVLRTLLSSSPSAPLLASLDSARRQYALHGQAILEELAYLSEMTQHELNRLEGILCRGGKLDRPGAVSLRDPARLVISALGRGRSGYELEAYLRYEQRIQIEMADAFGVVVVLTAGHKEEHLRTLIHAVESLPQGAPGAESLAPTAPPPFPSGILTPAHALRASSLAVPWEQAEGRLSAETVTLYPPGIPWLLPGEPIGLASLKELHARRKVGGKIQGAADLTLATVRVLVDDSLERTQR